MVAKIPARQVTARIINPEVPGWGPKGPAAPQYRAGTDHGK
jgi:hypothetical protein